ncbi:Allantoicase [Ceraceosorus guamensis]|uniref:Allantoicase n=1 Tax=Ceraceosorus guamensis TaxID=1522189 RepID=A0A316W3K4_9BASI|nr:Allantoicase [Ceraceosorus guamensis]PWN44477.1 Allantoicase [Ceraceosorus guamensis]
MTSNTWKNIALDQFARKLGSTSTEVSSVALGGEILSFSDEWFAPASDLLKVEAAPSLKGQFGPKGALFSGWETRRHNPTFDWVILRLGPAAGAQILGVDVDTAWFNGNEAPEVEVWALHLDEDQPIEESDSRWVSLLHRVPCGPSARHLWITPDEKPTEQVFTHIKLRMIPDGGIARFRVYGTITAPPLGQGFEEQTPTHAEPSIEALNLSSLDLAHVLNGGRVVFTSDQHFGIGPNVLLPGRGKDMGDGWETKRSRTPGHKDWLIIQLAEPAYLSYAEIDTLHFLGNFPESVALHGLALAPGAQLPTAFEQGDWDELVPRSKTGPHKKHFFRIKSSADSIAVKFKAYTHVRVAMFPDGGIKRVRLIGRRAKHLADWPKDKVLPEIALPIESEMSGREKELPAAPAPLHATSSSNTALQIPVEELTTENYATYGSVVGHPSQTSSSHMLSSTAGPAFKQVNQGTAEKYVDQSLVLSTYPQESKAETAIHTYRCYPHPALESSSGQFFDVKLLERHRYTTQAFLPLGNGEDQAYLVIVALNGEDDTPDLSTLKAYSVRGSTGITYAAGVWHHPMVVLPSSSALQTPIDFAVVVNESKIHPQLDCDEHHWKDSNPACRILVV